MYERATNGFLFVRPRPFRFELQASIANLLLRERERERVVELVFHFFTASFVVFLSLILFSAIRCGSGKSGIAWGLFRDLMAPEKERDID